MCACHACACHVMPWCGKTKVQFASATHHRPSSYLQTLLPLHPKHSTLVTRPHMYPVSYSSRSHLPILCLYHPQHTRNRTTSPTSSTRTWHDVAHVIRHQTFHHPGHTSNSAAQNSVPIHQKPNQNQAKRVLSFPVVKSVAQALCVSPMKTSKQKTRPCVYAQPNS
jgi:hypothetical protein